MNQETQFDIFIEIKDAKTDKLKTKIKMGQAPSIGKAERMIYDSFVNFCRDVAHKALERTTYINAIEWNWGGNIYRYYYLVHEDEKLVN